MVVVENCQFLANLRYALFTSNQDHDSGRQTIQATGNWWGTSDPLAIADAIYERSDISNSPIVNYSPFLTSSNLKGDFNDDRQIDFADLDAFTRCYGTITGDGDYDPNGDFDDDGTIDIEDLDQFSRVWGRVF
jgi:hypothetical protein